MSRTENVNKIERCVEAVTMSNLHGDDHEPQVIERMMFTTTQGIYDSSTVESSALGSVSLPSCIQVMVQYGIEIVLISAFVAHMQR